MGKHARLCYPPAPPARPEPGEPQALFKFKSPRRFRGSFRRADLEQFGVHYQNWYSERQLVDSGAVDRAVAALESAGHCYLQEGALWFKSTAFGDDKDRVIRRENGAYTYFASDIAYHAEKFARGFTRVIDMWGADHHGYVPRVKAALVAGGVFLLWKAARGLRDLGWAAFGLGMAAYWTGFWPF